MRSFPLLAIVLTAAIPPAQDETVSLEWKRSAGDEITVRITSELVADIVIRDSEGEKSREISVRGEAEFVQEIQEVEGNAAKVLRIECKRSTRQIGVKEEKTPLEGKTFFVRRSSPLSRVTVQGGGAVPSGASSLAGWENGARLLPNGEVAPGEKWKVAAKNVADLLSVTGLSASRGYLEVNLDSVALDRATISFSGTFEGKTADGYRAEFKVAEGRVVLDVANGTPVSVSVEAGIRLIRDVTEKKTEGLTKTVMEVGEVEVKSRRLRVDVYFD